VPVYSPGGFLRQSSQTTSVRLGLGGSQLIALLLCQPGLAYYFWYVNYSIVKVIIRN
jgi:hypothetical protein